MKLSRALIPVSLALVASAAFTTHSLSAQSSGVYTAAQAKAGAAIFTAQCQQCPVLRVCGGGLYPHRYRSGAGFRHPSVYCADLMKLITHVSDRVRGDVARLSTARSPR